MKNRKKDNSFKRAIPLKEAAEWARLTSPELMIKPKVDWPFRIANYAQETGFPEALFMAADGRCVGTWFMGNDYRVKSQYYGGYPAGYLKRIKSLFPDKKSVLHLCSGRVDLSIIPGDTVDINPALKPKYVADAQTCEGVPLEDYDLVMVDTPYSAEDCEHYGTPMLNRNRVVQVLGERLKPNTHVVWLDQVLPMYRKDEFAIEAAIGMWKSTNHRFRGITIFRKTNTPCAANPAR